MINIYEETSMHLMIVEAYLCDDYLKQTMKQLYLIRHAKSDWSNPDWTDFERPLNKRGLDNAPRMGEYLKIHNVLPNIIYSSDANRALSTARIIAEKIGYPVNDIVKQHSIYEKRCKILS